MTFENFPDETRIWVYGFSQPVNEEEMNSVKQRLKRFKEEWMYHGSSVTGDFDIIENQFVILATTEAISGCSIDSSVAVFKEFKYQYNLDALNQNLIFYRDGEEIKSVDRLRFQELLNQGVVNADTKVFNLMINHLGSFKNGDFEIPVKDSWHGKVFNMAEEVS